MISKRCLHHLRRLVDGSNPSVTPKCHSQPTITANHPALLPQRFRSMATVSDPPNTAPPPRRPSATADSVITTVYDFPSMEPLRFAHYPDKHLALPLRRDIVHRAVVYEGDKTRQGTAFVPSRYEIKKGSGRKLRPQKGMGKARLGDRKSPMLASGAKTAFGIHPRDYSTRLPRKVYDLAWRTALSYRYKRGELVVVDRLTTPKESSQGAYLQQILEKNGWGKSSKASMIVVKAKNKDNQGLFAAMKLIDRQGAIKELKDVDVKNLLEMGRIIIEQRALNRMILDHSKDLVPFLKPIAPPAEGFDFRDRYS